MTPARDVRDAMTDDYLDDAFDRCLAGRSVPDEAAFLEAFVHRVHALANQPVRPSASLAALLEAGLTAGPDTVVLPAVPVPQIARTSRPTRRRRTVLAGLATGLGLAFAGVTGAGAAGVLPDPVQGEVSGVLEAVTPLEQPEAADPTSASHEARHPQGVDTGRAPKDADSPAEAPAQAAFGRQVSEEAHGGGVDGQAVSEQARARHHPHRATPTSPNADKPGERGPAASPADAAPGRP
jgi:hypothetical protein